MKSRIERMKIAEKLVAAGFVGKPHNTNNSWGFGGSIGMTYTKDACTVRIATAHCRMSCFNTNFITVHFASKSKNGHIGRVLDVSQKYSPKVVKLLQEESII